MKIHKVRSWRVTYEGEPCDLVYDQATALRLWSRPSGRTLELIIQERTCITDRPGRGGDECYMCKREASEVFTSERTDRWN